MTTPRALSGSVIAVLVAVALSSMAVTVVGLQRDPVPEADRAADPPTTARPRPEVAAAAVLATWDAARAAAWADGDVRRLRSLYVAGSVAGRRDVAMLRRWLARGLVVRDLATQVLTLDVVSRSSDRWVLAVTDRVAGGVATGRGTRTSLPDDAASTRTVTLQRVGARWLVGSVR